MTEICMQELLKTMVLILLYAPEIMDPVLPGIFRITVQITPCTPETWAPVLLHILMVPSRLPEETLLKSTEIKPAMPILCLFATVQWKQPEQKIPEAAQLIIL